MRQLSTAQREALLEIKSAYPDTNTMVYDAHPRTLRSLLRRGLIDHTASMFGGFHLTPEGYAAFEKLKSEVGGHYLCADAECGHYTCTEGGKLGYWAGADPSLPGNY
jgi:hypothetical protein